MSYESACAEARSKAPESRYILDPKQILGVSVVVAVRSDEGGAVTLLFHHSIMAVVQ